MTYNLSSLMYNAWRYVRKGGISIAEAMRIAWANEKACVAAKAAAGITEETHTWAGWKEHGYEVIHESVALFQVVTVDPTKKKGSLCKSFFGASQVHEIAA